MDSPCRSRLDSALAASQHRCNEAPASFKPADPNTFTVLITGAVPNHKTILDAINEKTEVPTEVLLAGGVCDLMPLVAQLFRQPSRHVIPEATGINKNAPSVRKR